MSVEVTYVCSHTNKKVVTDQGLPSGWVIPSSDMSPPPEAVDEKTVKPLPRYTVVAFSSTEVMRQAWNDRFNRRK